MFDDSGYLVLKSKRKIDKLSSAMRMVLKPVEFMTDDELLALPAGSVFVFDVECYVNFFYVAFKCISNGKYIAFEQSANFELNVEKLNWVLWRFCLVSFNGINYDIPMISLALKGADCEKLKQASDFIIKGDNKPYTFEREYKLKIERYNHIDLMEVAPLDGSLKLYAGRLHCQTMQDLPFDEAHILTAEDAKIVRPYCCNDLDNTQLLLEHLAPELKLRYEMSDQYKVDLRSKSDAQIAEAVINSELQKITGNYPRKPFSKEGMTVKYNVPDFIKFESPVLNKVLEDIAKAEFRLDGLGAPVWPEGLGQKEKTNKGYTYVLKVKIGDAYYKLGMGGLHSQEKTVSYVADENTIIADNDVESYYPRIILNQRLFPFHLGEAFLQVYNSIVDYRIHAKKMSAECKKNGNKDGAKKWKAISDSLKIVINGSFGKLGNKWSTIYAPQLMLQVTITGQLCLLMLIEQIEKIGVKVISGNTDGVVSIYHKSRHEEVRRVIKLWEEQTNFKTEETQYSAIYSKDVNNYIAVNKKGGDIDAKFLDERLGCKTKGTYSERGSALNSILSKNPETLICTDAVLNLIVNKTPIIETIKNCKDIRRFVFVRNVKGGGEKNGIYLGKVVRWYYPQNEPGYIAYCMSGNKVANTDGGKPLMDLPKELPGDIDYQWYEKEANSMLFDIGFYKKAENLKLF
jgi:hypothetical protein